LMDQGSSSTNLQENPFRNLANSIYPKRLPSIKFGPINDEMGFTLSERLALRQAWNIISPFSRRYGQDVFYNYLNEYFWGIRKFIHKNELNLKALHNHAHGFVLFIGRLIEEPDHVMFNVILNDIKVTHNRCKVGSIYMSGLAQALVDYILEVLEVVSSPTLESGFRKIVEMFEAFQDTQPQT
ncbi:hypothetical protein KR018_005218, partial [Drosophila ironensis]